MNVAEPAETVPESSGCASAAVLLTQLGRWAARQCAGALTPIGLRERHLGTLLALRAGPQTQQSLGEALSIDAAQLVGLLNDLESEQLVRRRRDPDDRRRHIVEISGLGRARLEVTDRAMAQIDAKLMTGLTREQRAELLTLLRFVNEHGAYDEECKGKQLPCASEGDELT